MTVLLGHNGAGKSTTMSMMVGLFPPTAGSVHINGYNVFTHLSAARRSLGCVFLDRFVGVCLFLIRFIALCCFCTLYWGLFVVLILSGCVFFLHFCWPVVFLQLKEGLQVKDFSCSKISSDNVFDVLGQSLEELAHCPQRNFHEPTYLYSR